MEVPPAVADLPPLPSQCPAQPVAVPRARPGPFLTALQVRDEVSGCSEKPGISHDLAVAGGQEPRNANVNADLAPRRRERRRLGVSDDDDIPATVLPLELERFHRTRNAAMLLDLDGR
jgi:hypothetical protein